MSDPKKIYDWWRAALGCNFGPNREDEPMAGFYKSRRKNKQTGEVTFTPVAYWYDAKDWAENGTKATLFCLAGDKQIDDLRAREMWPWVSHHPITEDVYRSVRKGGAWPGESEAAAKDRALSNSANAEDENSFEALKDRIEDLARSAADLLGHGAAKTQEECDVAADLAERLGRLEKKSDEERAKEKAPHDAQSKTVQKKWAPIIVKAGDLKAALKARVVTPFLTGAKKQAEEERGVAVQTGADPQTFTRTKPRAGTATTVALRQVKTAIVEDWQAAILHFSEHPDLRDLVQRLANASARTGTCPAGCKLNIEEKAA